MTLLTLAALLAAGAMAQAGSTWLDRPMTAWNEPDKGVTPLQPGTEPQARARPPMWVQLAGEVGDRRRCSQGRVGPFLHFDQVIARDDIEVIGGMTASAIPGCEATVFNLFVLYLGLDTNAECRSKGGAEEYPRARN